MSFTEKAPSVKYECEGEVIPDVAASPKFQKYVAAPVVVLVKLKLLPLKHWLLLLMLNPEIGFGLTSKVLVVLSLQLKFVIATSFTVNAPTVT